MNIEKEFPIGMFVRKKKGYDWPGIVVSHSHPSTHVPTLNVENRLCPGTIHVFPPRIMIAEDRSDEEILKQVTARMLRRGYK